MYYLLNSLPFFGIDGKKVNLEFLWTPLHSLLKVDMLYFGTLISLEKYCGASHDPDHPEVCVKNNS